MVNVWSILFPRVYVKADKDEVEMRCRRDWELSTTLRRMEMRSVDKSVAVEFGTINNLGDNQLRYNYMCTTHYVTHICTHN